jgi:hypothetical protein
VSIQWLPTAFHTSSFPCFPATGAIVAYLNILADVISAVAGTMIPPGAEPSRNMYITGELPGDCGPHRALRRVHHSCKRCVRSWRPTAPQLPSTSAERYALAVLQPRRPAYHAGC